MKFGLFYLPTYLPAVRDAQTHYRGIVEQIEFADRIGIDYAWIVEHHFVRHGGLFPSNFAFSLFGAQQAGNIGLRTRGLLDSADPRDILRHGGCFAPDLGNKLGERHRCQIILPPKRVPRSTPKAR